MGPIKWSLFLAAAVAQCTCRRLLPSPAPPAQDLMSLAGAAASDLLQEENRGASDPQGTLILLCDGRSSSASPAASFARLSQVQIPSGESAVADLMSAMTPAC
ncbi:uncharacterized protein [Penaeus vannamei]|uniref:uncharacterized protein n=1 Tax=Penaeus vannamei TaxID=6689 RepID=UPI00387F5A09